MKLDAEMVWLLFVIDESHVKKGYAGEFIKFESDGDKQAAVIVGASDAILVAGQNVAVGDSYFDLIVLDKIGVRYVGRNWSVKVEYVVDRLSFLSRI